MVFAAYFAARLNTGSIKYGGIELKKILSALLCAALLLSLFCGCSSRDETLANKPEEREGDTSTLATASNTKTGKNDNSENDVVSSYKKPADTVSIDKTKEDPSNDDIKFTYDEDGRIVSYSYRLDERLVAVSYKYEKSGVEVYAFIGDTLVADELIELSEYDPEKGFETIEGYYFKGYTKA